MDYIIHMTTPLAHSLIPYLGAKGTDCLVSNCTYQPDIGSSSRVIQLVGKYSY